MSDRTTTGRGAIGGTSQLGGQQQGNITYSVMGEQLVKQLTQAQRDNPGTDFIVIQRVRQGESPKVWSTGDQEQTKDLFRHTYTDLAFEPA